MKITQMLLTKGKPARNGEKFHRPVDSIIIHWIGPYPGQVVSTPRNWWENGNSVTGETDGTGVRASAHFIIKDADVIQTLPLDEIGLHSGDTRNFHSIGIEVIPMNKEGEFSKHTIDTLRAVIKYIRQETGLDLSLERHYDGIQRKDCPRFYTPLSEVITKEEQYNNVEMKGEERWEYLKAYLNDWKR